VLLAQKYAPQLRFHSEEEHFPSTVEYFFAGPVSLYDKNGPYLGAPSPLTNENLAGLPDQGRKTYITANVEVDLHDFLKGQNPENSQPTTYTFIAPKPNGVVDLYYWIFCPFNFGKKTSLFGDKDFRASAMFSSI
jgi:Vacuolar protein sorting-associated protein 62